MSSRGSTSATIQPLDHGFNCDHHESYDAPSAALAWSRTLEFFGKHLG
jgi:carboxymethylenebutenolidase